LAAEGVQPLAEAIRDVPHHRPNRRSVGGIGKFVRREQLQSAARHGDHRRVALQKGVLLDGAVKRILRVRRVVALIERRRMIPQYTVGHSYFGCERLQRIEALVGVIDGGLQLAVLLGSGFQFVANGVVISDFPKHPRVRRHGRSDADGANQGENGNAVYKVGWYYYLRSEEHTSELQSHLNLVCRLL